MRKQKGCLTSQDCETLSFFFCRAIFNVQRYLGRYGRWVVFFTVSFAGNWLQEVAAVVPIGSLYCLSTTITYEEFSLTGKEKNSCFWRETIRFSMSTASVSTNSIWLFHSVRVVHFLFLCSRWKHVQTANNNVVCDLRISSTTGFASNAFDRVFLTYLLSVQNIQYYWFLRAAGRPKTLLSNISNHATPNCEFPTCVLHLWSVESPASPRHMLFLNKSDLEKEWEESRLGP